MGKLGNNGTSSFRASLAVVGCKATHGVMRILGRTARAMPGKVALRLDPDIIRHLSSEQGRQSIVITGTNGKTTTTHIIQQGILNRDGRAAYDPSSTNMAQGIATTLCLDSSLSGKRRSEWAVIECDEGASKKMLLALRPKVMVVTNLYRDQVDRYSDWRAARDYIVQAAKASSDTILVLDADCRVTASIASLVDNPVRWFGVDCDVYADGIADYDEDVPCPACGKPLSFSHRTFAHLGSWECPSCGLKRQRPDVACVAVRESNRTSCELTLRIDGEDYEAHANVRAGYDVYNAVAAVAGMLALGLSKEEAFEALSSFRHAAHRFEIFDVDGTQVRLLLMKNTAGCNQLINMLASEGEGKAEELVCLLGAEIMDGSSTAWIQDVRWEMICGKGTHVVVGGPKWDDMRDRLLATGVSEDDVEVEEDYGRLVDRLSATDAEDVTVIANCSTIEALRLVLVKRGYEPIEFWGDGTASTMS